MFGGRSDGEFNVQWDTQGSITHVPETISILFLFYDPIIYLCSMDLTMTSE